MTGSPFSMERKGFTLIEVVVAVAVFSMTALMAVNLFVLFIQHQRRTLNQQELQNDARAVIEQIAKDVREGSIDYTYYSTNFAATPTKLFSALGGTGNECLVLRNSLNEQIRYRLNGAIMQRTMPASTDTAKSCSDPLLTWEAISPTSLSVSSFSFSISPSEDPFAAASAIDCGKDASDGTASSYSEVSCRWGTVCQSHDGVNACQNGRGGRCYCFPQKFGNIAPLHPRVTFSLNLTRTNNQQTVSQVFQTAVASRIFKNIDRLNTYVP